MDTDSLQSAPLKQCSKCPSSYPATSKYFYSYKGKLRASCKSCDKSANKRYREAKHEAEIARTRNYYATHMEQFAEYRVSHREHRIEQNKQWNQENREHVFEQRRRFRKDHPDVIHMQKRRYMQTEQGKLYDRKRHHQRRARQNSVPGSYTPAQIAEQLRRQKYRCYYADCGFSKFKRIKEHGEWKYIGYDVEHTFPISRVAGSDIPANDMSYLVLSCPTCNRKKGKKFPWEFPEGGRLL